MKDLKLIYGSTSKEVAEIEWDRLEKNVVINTL